MQLGRLWRTVRWLKPEQVIGRLIFRLRPVRPDLRAPPPLRPAGGPWVTPPQREASLLSPTRLRLLNEEHDVDHVGWDDPAIALLWRYNLHYFDDLNAIGATTRRQWQRQLMHRWLVSNPPGHGTGWAPYPTSLRIVNWIKWFVRGEEPTEAQLHSLAVQARWLRRRLEWHLLGNHLFANAKALVFAGLFFDGAEAQRWLDSGLSILRQELPEQVLADGAQFERTPMYHALALEDLVDLLNLAQALGSGLPALQQALPEWRRTAAAMLLWLRRMRHPGGALARFNDCAEGIAPPTDAIEAYAAALGIQAAVERGSALQLMQPSGYLRASRGPAVLLADLAPIGPDYLPGHAHADTLSFELSVHGRELLVNRGTSVYGSGARRQLERGTAAHNTVQIGDHDSSEVWSGFRVGRRARPGPVSVQGWAVEGSHDGYKHLPGAPLHRRRWSLEEDDSLLVEDQVIPPPTESATARFHLAPGLTLQGDGALRHVLDADGTVLARVEILAGRARPEHWQHALRFGVLVPAQTLAVTLDSSGVARLRWHW